MAKVEYLGPRTARSMKLEHWLRQEGFTRAELVEEMANHGCAPALCTLCSDRWIELDGTCEHGNPAASMVMV